MRFVVKVLLLLVVPVVLEAQEPVVEHGQVLPLRVEFLEKFFCPQPTPFQEVWKTRCL